MKNALALCFLLSGSLGSQSPESIRPAGSFRLVGLIHDAQALNQAHDVEVQGGVAFVAGKGGNLAMVDISKAGLPRLLASLRDPVEFEDAETVLPLGGVLFLGSRDFFAIDIHDPAHPKVLKKISQRPRVDRINGMSRWRNYIFTANKTGFVSVFDVSNPRDPALHDVLDTKASGGLGTPHAIETMPNHIIVTNTGRGENVHVRLYRITDPATGKLLPASQWKTEGSAPSERDIRRDWSLAGANCVTVWDRYSAVGAFVADRVAIFELPAPGKLTQIANMPVCDIDATGMTVSGRILFVAGGECVEAIDVSDPAHPVSVAQYRGGALFPTRAANSGEGKTRYDNAHDLVYRDGYLYVTAQNDHQLGVLQLTDPELVRNASTRSGRD